ncbi:hypothetical protein QTO34_001739 [Cnephaeus nilssonii]|uniref:Uncharacterized protein n=1 Tax=Cnephaeus nilssonii TaxID=3371016 RepID=A0AA40HTS1_CNENI|nr:hypothetical protein QTO34_001739 [Eptesicus nilssonii]
MMPNPLSRTGRRQWFLYPCLRCGHERTDCDRDISGLFALDDCPGRVLEHDVSLINSLRQETVDLAKQTQGESHRPLRRSKRRWVVTTLELQEEDPDPFPN